MTPNKILLVFIPLLVLAGLALFIRIVQYEPLVPKIDEADKQKTAQQVPIFADDPISGDRKARLTLIAFEDFACANCKVQADLLKSVQEQYPQAVKIVWKVLPVTRYPVDSTEAAKYSFCANAQGKFEAFKEYAFQNGTNLSQTILQSISEQIALDPTKLEACLASPAPQAHIDTTKALANQLNVQALPTMFLNNKQIPLPTNIEGWKTLLEI